MYTLFRIFFITILVASLAACHLKVPSAAEQKALMERGAFPSGTPGWVSSGVSSHSSGGVLIPGGAPEPKSSTLKGMKDRQQEREEVMLARREQLNSNAEEDRGIDGKGSPLERITKICPGLESNVSDAITTVERKERVKKYERLTTRCPSSWDLWLWLGEDYFILNQNAQAGRCFEQVLILNSANVQASKLLAEVRKRQAPGS